MRRSTSFNGHKIRRPFIVNGLAPAEVAKVVLDEEANRIEVVVPDDQFESGHRSPRTECPSGVAADRMGYRHSDRGEESERRTEESRTRSKLFIDALDVDDVIAQLLVTEGFTSLEEVAYVGIEDLSEIEGFDETVAAELQEAGPDFPGRTRRAQHGAAG